MTAETQGRAALVAATIEAERRGLNHNSTGNLSARCGDYVLVTPSGVPPGRLTPGGIVAVALDGRLHDPAGPTPTSEIDLHLEVYRRRPDVGAIVHTHSPEATAAACVPGGIEAVHYIIALTGAADVRCAPYATYGTPELARVVADTLGPSHAAGAATATGPVAGHPVSGRDGASLDGRGRRACLMANHGAIALGATLDAALGLAHDLEWLCGVARRARQWGAPTLLPADEISRVAQKFTRYGQPAAQ